MLISFMCFWEHVEEGILDTSQMYNLYFVFPSKQKVREYFKGLLPKLYLNRECWEKQESDSDIKEHYYLFVRIVCNHSQRLKN